MMRNIFTLFIAAISAVIVALGLAAPALADDVELNPAATPIPISETVNAGATVDMSDIAYTIAITAKQGHPQDTSAPTGVYTGPDIQSAAAPIVIVPSDAATTTAGATTNFTDSVKTWDYTRTLVDLFGSASAFPQAGLYEYEITQIHANGTSADTTKWDYSEPTYTLQVSVKNNAAVDGLEFAGWTLVNDLSKVNSGAQSDDGKAAFSATYKAKSTLNITKQVSGDYASTTYDFPITITLTLPEYSTGTIASNIVPTNASLPNGVNDTDNIPSTKQVVYTTELHHGETASFDVPIGTRYSVDETNLADDANLIYTASIEWTVSQPIAPVSLFAETPTNYGSVFLVADPSHGVEDAIDSAIPGSTVYVEVLPDENYETTLVTVNDNPIIIDNGVYSFTVSNEPVTVRAYFAGVLSNLISSQTTNGNFVLCSDPSGSPVISSARYGEIVSVVATPDSGYELDTITVNDGAVSVTVVGNLGTFSMPPNAVNVAVSFSSPPSMSESYTTQQLITISEDIRNNGSNSVYYEQFVTYARNGERVGLSSDTATDPSMKRGYEAAMLVDVNDNGLIFMMTKGCGSTRMSSALSEDKYNTDTTGGWPQTQQYVAMNDSDGFVFKRLGLDALALNGVQISPHSVTNQSYVFSSEEGKLNLVSSNDTFWIPSFSEIYGEAVSDTWKNYFKGEEGKQFEYLKTMNISDSNCSALPDFYNPDFKTSNMYDLQLRSAGLYAGAYMNVSCQTGSPVSSWASNTIENRLCFCL